MRVDYQFNGQCVENYFLEKEAIRALLPTHSIIITDENVYRAHGELLAGLNTLVIPAGEPTKNLATVEGLVTQMLDAACSRNTLVVGFGGGVVTDIAGFVASVFMRGVKFGFVPTTLLAMVDAAIGGKNGVNVGLNKNMAGTILQPNFIVYCPALLRTLPEIEFVSGFAEIVKYACVFDDALFTTLENHDIEYYMANEQALRLLIERCMRLKYDTVIADERELGERKFLNFGHTAGHAIETLYGLPHGFAVAIGMVIAANISKQEAGFDYADVGRLKRLLARFHLPTSHKIDITKVMALLVNDKKKADDGAIQYILLEKLGKAMIKKLPVAAIQKAILECTE